MRGAHFYAAQLPAWNNFSVPAADSGRRTERAAPLLSESDSKAKKKPCMATGRQAFTALELIFPNYPEPWAKKKSCKMGLHTEVFHVAVKRINSSHHSDSRHKNSSDSLQRAAHAERKVILQGLKVAI